MDYKEKYEMALEGIQEILGSGEDSIKMSRLQLRLQGIFPELKESEDEEIRKFLIQMAQNGHGEDRDWWNKCVAWLEKQQKPIASSKFKVGDKVVHKGTGKLWTVHWYIKEDNVYSVKDSEGLIHIYSPDVLELIEQKPAWSEDDEARFKSCVKILQTSDGYDTINVKWLKSLKDRVGCASHFTTTKQWSKEDRRIFDNINLYIRKAGDYPHFSKENIKETIDWLKSLKDRVIPQPKQEWSEEDEIARNALINLVEMYYGGCINKSEKNRLLDWLKSLRPQSNWKPSDEQMVALRNSIPENVMEISEREMLLDSLYQDLKKLREE